MSEKKLKKLVIQLAVKLEQPLKKKNGKISTFSYVEEMYRVSEKKAKEYAKKCEADYYIIKNPDDWMPGKGHHIAFQKFKVYDFLNYDRILYIDADYIIKDSAPNIFELYNDFAAVVDPGNDGSLSDGIGISKDRYFNSGFLYFTKETLFNTKEKILNCDLSAKWKLKDQAVWNKIMYESNIDFIKLSPEDWNPILTPFGKYGDHYTGISKSRWGEVEY